MSAKVTFDTSPDFAKQVQEAFFVGMAQCYVVTNGSSRSRLVFPNWKRFVVLHGRFSIINEWSNRGGRTFIEIHDNKMAKFDDPPKKRSIVWMMRYFGHYEDWAIPVLKTALSDRYKAQEFCGGRGSNEYAPAYEERLKKISRKITDSGGWKDTSLFWKNSTYGGSFNFYVNRWTGGFERFSGKEEIYTEHFPRVSNRHYARCGGSYEYWGGLVG